MKTIKYILVIAICFIFSFGTDSLNAEEQGFEPLSNTKQELAVQKVIQIINKKGGDFRKKILIQLKGMENKIRPDKKPILDRLVYLINNFNINNQGTSMKTIDPKAQILINKYHELLKNVSEGAKQGQPNENDWLIEDKLVTISRELKQYDTATIKVAMLNTYDYGFELSIIINNHTLGAHGGGSYSTQLFDANSIQTLVSTPDIVAENFVLHKGVNTITIKYKKINKNSNDTLKIGLSSYFSVGQNFPDDDNMIVVVEAKNKTEGIIEKTFVLESEKPKDFQTITISE